MVLAASRGAELGALTEDRPKCMIDVRGQPLLRRLVGTLRERGIRDVTVVRGYRKEAIDLPALGTSTTTSTRRRRARVARLRAERLAGPCVLTYGDILFRRHILDALLAADGDIVLAVDALRRSTAGADPKRVSDLVGCSRRYRATISRTKRRSGSDRIGNELR